jgi:glycosyltransferase involved in cell wall biosynthesis
MAPVGRMTDPAPGGPAVTIDAMVYGLTSFGGLITMWDALLPHLEARGAIAEVLVPPVLKKPLPVAPHPDPPPPSRPRVFHSTYLSLPPPTTVFAGTVATVHDLIYEDHPDLAAMDPVPHATALKRRCITSATAIVCPSRATANALIDRHAPDAPVFVVPHGLDPAFRPAGTDGAGPATGLPPGPFIAHVGGRDHYKRFGPLLDVLLRSRALRELRIVVVGSATAPTAAEAEVLDQHGARQRVSFIGYVSRQDLIAIYRAASLVVCPSAVEGFGLPLIESLACGTPVVCSDIPAHRENGDTDVEYFDLDDEASFEPAALRGLDHTSEHRMAASRRVIERFTWERATDAMVHAYRSATDR